MDSYYFSCRLGSSIFRKFVSGFRRSEYRILQNYVKQHLLICNSKTQVRTKPGFQIRSQILININPSDIIYFDIVLTGTSRINRIPCFLWILCTSQVPEFIDPVFTKTSPKRSFSMTENERFGLVFAKTGSINSDKGFGSVSGSGSAWIRINLSCWIRIRIEIPDPDPGGQK